MRIGVIGTGNMGRSIGLLWAEQGHEVCFGDRNAEKAEAAAQLSEHGCRFGTNDDAAAFGELVYYTPRDVDPAGVLSDVGLLDGKIVMESNNGPVPPDLAFAPIEISRSEVLQRQLPRARVVKAFNTMAQEVFELCPGEVRQHGVSVFVAGDDAEARSAVVELAEQIGMVPLDCGALRNARLIETLGDFIRLVIIPSGEPLSTLSVHVLPESRSQRLGGRQPSRLDADLDLPFR